ncbi:hypothetical protein ACH5RR_040762 [Cinchona calisaya]|uniref:CBF1-interacting co-repressor CIR N-terminal domain-containing protein n=1 Tax=Cinchona calisaya TaxID=153742 RepID=A0ABD2XVP0_9GENT
MDEEEGGGIRLSKRFSDKGGEVDYKTKAGTAWSHSYLNQKPWHPLSYPNQRRKWIAEQTHAHSERRAEEVAREYAQEQEFFRQTALVSKKEKEKMEMMKAVSFMYVRPPGYNAESATAADMADKRKQEQNDSLQGPSDDGASSSMKHESMPSGEEKKKPRPKDVFGRALPTEEQFEVLKNAPRLETGVPARSKPFGVEIRNVKCLRCGNFGHQSGDRECPLKDAIMPSDESRLKRDDPLTSILAQTDVSEPLKWELKQKPGLSPPRGGYGVDDPNQQIVAEDIFDEYGGFLIGDNIPKLLSNFSSNPKKKSSSKRKHKQQLSPAGTELSERSSSGDDKSRKLKKKRHKKSSRKHSASSFLENSDYDVPNDHQDDNRPSTGDRVRELKKKRHNKKPRKHSKSSIPESSDSDMPYYDDDQDNGSSSGDERERRSSNKKKHKRESRKHSYSSQSENSDYDRHRKRSSRYNHSHPTSSENSDSVRHYKSRNHRRHRH